MRDVEQVHDAWCGTRLLITTDADLGGLVFCSNRCFGL